MAAAKTPNSTSAASANKRPRARVVPIHAPPPAPVHPFDRQFGTDTGGLIRRDQLLSGQPSDAHITAYYAVAPSILDALVDLWLGTRPPYAIDRYTFLDLGAGKGRAIMSASLHPFERVVGVELNPGLAAVARENLHRFAERASPLAPVAVVAGDVLTAELPDGPTVVFLFHPFEAPLLRRMMRRLETHFTGSQAAHRTLDLLYVNAEHGSLLDANPAYHRLFHGLVPMSATDHLADLAEIAGQVEYGSTGDELCSIYRLIAQHAGEK